jgi:thiol-disulfide isomerase/thioredoxin
MTSNDQPVSVEPKAKSRTRTVAIAAAAGIVIGLAGVYGIATSVRNAGDPACGAAVDLGRRISHLIKGEVAAVIPASAGLRIPDIAFQDGGGASKSLADWRGRFVLLNLWATWCVPCRTEMPALDALQKQLGSANFEVVALNIDTRDLDKPKAFYREAGISSLGYFADEQARSLPALKRVGRLAGMPTSILIDRAGCEVATIAGPAEWASDDAVKFIRGAISGG